MSHEHINQSDLNRQTILRESKDPVDISEEDILHYARQIGIELPEEDDLLWIAVRGLLSTLPTNWLPVEDSNGRIYYYNSESGVSTWNHPADKDCKELLEKAREYSVGLQNIDKEHQSTFNQFIFSLVDESTSSLPEKQFSNKYLNSSKEIISKMSFVKKVPPLSKPNVRFDTGNLAATDQFQYTLEGSDGSEHDSELDDMIDKFGLMDAGSLSPILMRSPEPEDVNSLLRLTSNAKPMDLRPLTIGHSTNTQNKSSLPVMGMQNPLKPLSPVGKLQTVKSDPEKVRTVEILAAPLLSTMGGISANQEPPKTRSPSPIKAETRVLKSISAPVAANSKMGVLNQKLNPIPETPNNAVTVAKSAAKKENETLKELSLNELKMTEGMLRTKENEEKQIRDVVETFREQIEKIR